MNTPHIIAIITCYFPKVNELVPLIRSICNQVDAVILINNGGLDKNLLSEFANLKLDIVDTPHNVGTAGGYNIGSKLAWDKGFSHVLLLDQDSECAPDMIQKLLSVESFLVSSGKKVAVVGPYYISKNTNLPAPFIQHSGYLIQRIYETSESLERTKDGALFTECSYVISSGSLISQKSWASIGGKDEKLFLDFTDIEWGLRARSLGYACYGSFAARMFHLIGDEQVNFMGRKISLHSPLRHYYAFRNCVWLSKQSYIPLGTRFNYLLKLAPKLLVYSWFSNEPLSQMKSMLRGIRDGIANRMGIFQK